MLGLEDPVLGKTSSETWTHPVPQYSPDLELMKTKLVAFQDATKQDILTVEKLGAHDVDRPTTVQDTEDHTTTWQKYAILSKKNAFAFLWNIGRDAHGITEKTILETAVFRKLRADYKIFTRNFLVKKMQAPKNNPATSQAEAIGNNDNLVDVVNINSDLVHDFEGFEDNVEASGANTNIEDTLEPTIDPNMENGVRIKQIRKQKTKKQSEYNSQLEKSKDHMKDMKLTELSEKIKQVNIKNAKLEK